MKKIYLSLLAAIISVGAIAQCSVTATMSQNGNVISVSSNGTGATDPVYVIEWGDGTNSFSQQADHTYEADGVYQVCVSYLDQANPFGCNDQECQLFVVGSGGCAVNFEPVISGFFVSVSATGTGGTNPSFSINWGDGSAPTAASSGNHTYTAEGTYDICVTYSTPDCDTESCRTVTIGGTAACTVDANFTITGNTVSVTSVGSGASNPQYAISWDNGGIPTLAGEGSYTYTQSGTYLVCVIYIDMDNTSTCNANDCQEITLNVGVEETSNFENGVKVYPNPVNNNASIQLNLTSSEYTVVELFNLVGEKVSTISASNRPAGASQISWNTSDLASGIYFVQVTAGSEKQTIKVIKE